MSNEPSPPASLTSRRRLLQAAASCSAIGSIPAYSQSPTAGSKRIYIAADDHTDYMWTADEKAYREAFIETLDHYLDLADQTEQAPVDYQSRWNCDGLLWFLEYERHRDENEVARLVSRIKSGHVSIPMTMLVSCYGGTPTEAVLRGLYSAGRVERQYRFRISIAVSMENQTLPRGLGMLWAGSGVKYSWKGICGCASKVQYSASVRDHEVYWWVGPDGSRVLMKWYSLAQPLRRGVYWNEGPGGYAEARHPALAIEYVDKDPGFLRKHPHTVIGLFGQGWDAKKTIVPLDDQDNSFPAVAKRLTTRTRRVIVSNEHDYFSDMEASYGDELPEVSCGFGNEWELYTASLAEVSASVRRATEKLRTAEAMATWVSRQRPAFGSDLSELREQAWVAFGLYWEHDWTADGPISRQRRAAWQRKIAGQIQMYVDRLFDRSAKALGELIKRPDSEGRCLFVFNALGWRRDDYVDVRLSENETLVPFDLDRDQEIPSQIITRDGKRYVRFIASGVPACGYRLFHLRSGIAPVTEPTIQWTGSELTSSKHRLQILEDGSIGAWVSLELDRALVTGRANSLEAARGRVSLESAGSVSTTVRIDVARPIARTTRVTLFESLERIEIDNTIRESFSDPQSWRFDFSIDDPQTCHEEVGAIVRAAIQSDGGDYADRNARTDWLTLNHFVRVRNDSIGVSVSNRDCLFFHLGENTADQMDSSSSTLHILAGGQVDGPKLGIPNQGGDRRFHQRFALTCGVPEPDSDQTSAMKVALEHSNPLVFAEVTGSAGELGVSGSAIDLDSEQVLLWALKPSEDGAGQGTIVRLWNTSPDPAPYRLSRASAPITECIRTTHIETDEEAMEVVDGVVSETLPPGAIRTLRIM